MSGKEVSVDKLKDYCEELARDLMRDHEKRFADRMRMVKEASVGLENAANRLALGVKNAWGTMEKQASEYGMRLAQMLQENAQKLSRRGLSSDFHQTESFHQDAVKTLNEIIITVRRYVPKLHKALKPEMATLNSSLMRLEKAVQALGVALDESPGLKLDSLQREVEALLNKQDELTTLKSENRNETEFSEEASSREKEFISKKQELMSGSEFIELTKFEQSLKLKEDEIRQFLQPLTKPLLKLERTAGDKRESTVDLKALRDLIENPIQTVVSGRLYASIQLLDLLHEALKRGELEIEERKRRKAEEAIVAVKEGALDRMKDEYLALQANTQETLRQLKSKGLLDNREDLDKQLADIHAQIEEIKDRQRELQRRNNDLTQTISKLKGSVESRISKIAHRAMTVGVD